MPLLAVKNDRTELIGADELFLHILDKELRYPSQLAQYQVEDISIPSDDGWDGWVRMLHRRKTGPPWVATGLLPYVQRVAERFGFAVSLDDRRERPEEGFPELVRIPLRDYQEEAVKEAVRAGRGVLDMPPRSGKTRTMCEIVRRVALPTVWMAPTDRIVKQTVETLTGFFGRGFADQIIGADNYLDALKLSVVVCTAATAGRLPLEFYASRQCVAIDEFHHAAASTYRHVMSMCNHIYYRYGMTGTFFRSGADIMALHAMLSNTIYKVTSEELLRRGYLVPTYVAFVPVIAPHLRGVSNTFNAGHGKFGIHEHVGRNQLVGYCALTLLKAGRRVLILVGTKKQGRLIQDILLNFVRSDAGPGRREFKPVEFVSTDVDRPKQARVLDSFEKGEEVKILIGTSLLGEGVDMPSTDALVYARGEQAEVGLTQAMYRVSTAVEGKKQALIVDFADRHNRHLMKHSRERLRVYFNEPTFHVSVLDVHQNLPSWILGCPGIAA